MSVLTGAKKKRTYLRADARRAQILDVAKDVFAGRGYHEANVADICKAARIGRGTLYLYFENKRDVLLALMEDLAARIKSVLATRAKVEDFPDAAKVPAPLIVKFCKKRLREILDAVFVDEATLRLVLRDARGADGAIDEIIMLADRLLLGAIEADTRAAMKAGVFRHADAHKIALYILGGIEKLVMDALSRDEPVDRDAIIDAAVDLEMFGLLREEVRR
jgi:AcrR family transcriptional regulator